MRFRESDDDDYRPRKARKASRYDDDDDDDDYRPRKAKKASRYDDDDEDEDDYRPRKAKKASRYDDDDEEEEERPRRKSAKKASRYDDDEEEEEEERPKKKAVKKAAKKPAKKAVEEEEEFDEGEEEAEPAPAAADEMDFLNCKRDIRVCCIREWLRVLSGKDGLFRFVHETRTCNPFVSEWHRQRVPIPLQEQTHALCVVGFHSDTNNWNLVFGIFHAHEQRPTLENELHPTGWRFYSNELAENALCRVNHGKQSSISLSD